MPKEIFEIIMNLISNAVIIFSIIFVYVILRFEKNKISKNIISGIILGGMVILLMHDPWVLREGVFFDARTVMLSIIGLFFGLVPTLIAAVIAIGYRLTIAGGGVLPGILTIVLSGGFGVFWHNIRKKLPKMNLYLEYLFFGFIVSVLTILAFLTMPYPQSVEILRITYVPFLIVFPIATMLVSVVIHFRKEKIEQEKILAEQKAVLQSSIDSTAKMEFFAVDKNYNYIAINDFHCSQMRTFYVTDVNIGENYLNYIDDEETRLRIKECIDKAFAGEIVNMIFEVEVNKGKYLEEHYTPIKNSSEEIFGVAIRSIDITERYENEQKILKLSYYDALTNLYNRRSYEENIIEFSKEKYYPLSVIFADINGLKITNDAFGHDAADELLKFVAEKLVKNFGFNQYISRIGGDEFAVLLPNTSYAEAQKMLAVIEAKFEKLTIYGMNISISFGLATKKCDRDIDLVIKEAENMMYTNKLIKMKDHRAKIVAKFKQMVADKMPYKKDNLGKVTEIALKMGKKLKLRGSEIKMLKIASELYDIGKVAIDEKILNKKGKLTEKEWTLIKKHPEIGYRIIVTIPDYAAIAEDILYHHERFDGFGYPRGLKGDEIPFRARIIAIASSYEAMTSERPYKKKMSHAEAVEEIKRCSKTQFDPKLVKVFLDVFAKNDTNNK